MFGRVRCKTADVNLPGLKSSSKRTRPNPTAANTTCSTDLRAKPDFTGSITTTLYATLVTTVGQLMQTREEELSCSFPHDDAIAVVSPGDLSWCQPPPQAALSLDHAAINASFVVKPLRSKRARKRSRIQKRKRAANEELRHPVSDSENEQEFPLGTGLPPKRLCLDKMAAADTTSSPCVSLSSASFQDEHVASTGFKGARTEFAGREYNVDDVVRAGLEVLTAWDFKYVVCCPSRSFGP